METGLLLPHHRICTPRGNADWCISALIIMPTLSRAAAKRLKRTGAKVVMEIPTYPYDQEYVTRSMKLGLAGRPLFPSEPGEETGRHRHFFQCGDYLRRRTIRISNGIDFDDIPMKRHCNDTSHELHLIGVAEVHYGTDSTASCADWRSITGRIPNIRFISIS